MPSKQINNEIDVLGFLFTKPATVEATKAYEPFMANLKVKFDPATGSTIPDESDLVDLDKLIQTYKDQCGMELARKLIKQGIATDGDFADDGKHSGNVPAYLETAQGRANAAVLAKNQADALAATLGVSSTMTEEQLTAIISKTIAEKFPQMIKQEAAKDGE